METDRRYGNISIAGPANTVIGDVYQQVTLQIGQPVSNAAKSKVLIESLIFDRWDARLRDISSALDRTCQWLINHPIFHKWLDPEQIPEHGGFLWLKGKPGSGKSTLMKEAIAWMQRVRPEDLVLTYFFNARSPYELEKSSLGLYRSLTYQLLRVWPDGATLFVKHFSSKERNGKMTEEWRIKELQNFLYEHVDHPNFPSFALFIDALDEGEEDDVRSMIGGLVDLTQKCFSGNSVITVCLSSRHYPSITIEKGLFIIVEQQNGHRKDIELYVDVKLRGRSDPSMRDLQQQVLDRSQGIFLWTVLAVTMLNGLHDKGYNSRRRFEKLKQIPQQLYSIFYDLVTQDTETLEECITLLQLVLFSLRPLVPRELCAIAEFFLKCSEDLNVLGAIAEDYEMLTRETASRRIIHYSRGLVEVRSFGGFDWDIGIVQFTHETVREFLLEQKVVNLGGLESKAGHVLVTHFRADQCHTKMAIYCLRYMAALPIAPRSPNPNDRRDFMNGYASRYWWQHFQAIKTGISEELLTLATDLFLNESRLSLYAPDIDLYLELDDDSVWPFIYKQGSYLYYAAAIGVVALVQTLIDRGAAVDAFGGYWETALNAACAYGHEEVVRLLISAGADVNAKDEGYSISSALYVASNKGHADVVKVLLVAGADANAKGGRLGTALGAACRYNRVDVVRLLVDAGGDANGRGANYESPLYVASAEGHEETVKILLAKGGKFDTALRAACKHGMVNIVKLVVDARADTNAKGELLDDALRMACQYGRVDLVQILVKAGADVEAVGRDGRPALYLAARDGHDEVVKLLLKIRAEPDSREKAMDAALQAALRKDHPKVIQTLMDAGANFNAQEGHYTAALYSASRKAMRRWCRH